MRALLALAVCCACALACGSDTEPQGALAVHGRFEAMATAAQLGVAASIDPYDPDQVRIDARLTAPDGVELVQPCFWIVAQERFEQLAFSTERKTDVPWERFRDADAGHWCLRFSPSRPGLWRWRWEISNRGGTTRMVEGAAFTATPTLPPGSGPVTLSRDGRALGTADGQAFIPVGINCAWPTEAGSTVYAQWLDHLAAAGGNATRLWLVHYYGGTALEWTSSGVNDGYAGVGHYSQEAAARVDRILEACEQREVKVMLCLYTFGDLNWDWEHNPYAHAGGGWLKEPREFFTDARARAATRKLLRYEVARWGWSRALWAWELWNEVDTCDGFDDHAVTAWHAEMGAELKRLDAHHHLVTTDYRFTPPASACGAYALPEIAFSQLHTYWPLVPEAFSAEMPHLGPFAKPVVIGEYGLHVEPSSLAADPVGLHLHDGLWGGLFCGSAGGGMGWWWDVYVEPRGLWAHCRGLAGFVRDERLDGLAPTIAATDAGEAAPALALAGDDRLWAWVRNAREVRMQRRGLAVEVGSYRIPRPGAASRLKVDGHFTGAWQVDFFDPYDGVRTGSANAMLTPAGLEIPLPPYRHDLALKARRADKILPPQIGPPSPTPWHDEVQRRMEERK